MRRHALHELDIRAEQSRFSCPPIVRLALKSDLAPQVRAALLERTVDLLSAHEAPPQQGGGSLLQLAPGSGRPIEPRRAAAIARARGAPDAAVTYLQRALAEPPVRVAVLHEPGQAAHECHRGPPQCMRGAGESVEIRQRVVALAKLVGADNEEPAARVPCLLPDHGDASAKDRGEIGCATCTRARPRSGIHWSPAGQAPRGTDRRAAVN
jgi:hypothetical protein